MNIPQIGRAINKDTTRFVFTPTGPAHIGHVFTAYANRTMALLTGGVFGYRMEEVLALVSMPELREVPSDKQWPEKDAVLAATGIPQAQLTLAHRYGYDNVRDMCALGITPLRHQTVWQSHNGITDWFWKFFDWDVHYDPWPGELPKGAVSYPSGAMLATFTEHPYIVLNRVVSDIDMRCTTVLRGEDLRHETSDYMKFAWMVVGHRKELIPVLDYLPVLKQSSSSNRGESAYSAADGISSSDPSTCENLRVKDVLAAGISGDKLIHYLENIYFYESVGKGETEKGDLGQLLPSGRVNPSRYAHAAPVGTKYACLPMNPYPIVHLEDWERFMATGEVEPKIEGGSN